VPESQTHGLKTRATVQISAHTGEGLPELRHALDQLAFGAQAQQSTLALNARHLQALADARNSVQTARASIENGPELLAADLREALDHLGAIVGSVSPDELLGRIFSRFCIGK
jgi:tRNA modification GTPase